MHTALIGASRGIGRSTALELLSDPLNRVSLLLRTPDNITADPQFAQAIDEGRVRIVKGDAYEKDDLRALLGGEDEGIDSIVFTLGAVYPNGKRQFSWSKGFLLPSPDVCTSATLKLVEVLEEMHKAGKAVPAIVAVSVTGVGSSVKYLPYVFQPILPWLLSQTIDDKRGVESILSHISALPSESVSDPPSAQILNLAKLEQLTPNFVPQVLVIRPAQLKDTDGSRVLRAGEEVTTYATGRIELGRWIAGALRERGRWMNRRVTVGF